MTSADSLISCTTPPCESFPKATSPYQFTDNPDTITWNEQYYVYIEGIGEFSETAPACWAQVYGNLDTIKSQVEVKKFCSFYRYDLKPKQYRAGVMVSAPPSTLPADFHCMKYPGGIYSRFILTGSLSNLPVVCGRVDERVKTLNLQKRDDWQIEYYVTDAMTTKPEENVIEILVPTIESKESHEQVTKKAKVDGEYVPYIANGYHSLTTYLSTPMHQCLKAIDWYKQAFGASEIFKMMCGDGKQVMHAELQFGTSRFMMSDADPRWDSTPYSVGSAMTMCFYTPDVDALYARALKAGAKSKMPPTDMFYGDRQCSVIDPFGVKWMLMTHIKDVSYEEMQRLGREMEEQCANGKDSKEGACGTTNKE